MKKIKILLMFLTILIFVNSCRIDSVSDPSSSSDTTTTITKKENSSAPTISGSGIDFMTALIIVVVIIIIVAFSFFFFKNIFPVALWFKAITAGTRIGLRSFLNMYFQHIPPELIVNNMIKARKAGLILKVKTLENIHLSGVDINELIDAHIEADNAGVKVEITKLSKAALAKVNVKDLIKALILIQGAKINITFDEIVNMYHIGVDVVEVVKAKIETKNSKFPIEIKLLSEHYLAGGDLKKTTDAYVAAKKANLHNFDFSDIADLDLAGYNVYNIVEKAIIPSVVEGDRVRGIARDGIEISMKLKVTLRAKLKSIIGNPEEGTILARINENLATEIGLSESHYHVLQSPYALADKVEQKKLDKNTAFEVLSIDVSDVSIGKDVMAELKTERAKADAEKAKTDVIKADERLKKSMASAFLEGNLTPKEYENLLNIQADTKMRQNLSKDLENNNQHNDQED